MTTVPSNWSIFKSLLDPDPARSASCAFFRWLKGNAALEGSSLDSIKNDQGG